MKLGWHEPEPARRGAAAVMISLLAAASATSASAVEHCVVCAGPDAVYRCQIDTVATGRREAGAQLVCITSLAKEGGHQTCSVRRAASELCQGPLKVVTLPEGGSDGEDAAPSVSAGGGPAAAATSAAAEQPTGPSKGAPQTVEALAAESARNSSATLKSAGETVADTAKAAGEQIGKAGSAVAGAAKKTWGCIASLFSDCK